MNEQPLEAVPIPLDQVRPDPKQPRHLFMPEIDAALEAGTLPADLLMQLRSRAEHAKWIRERITELDGLAKSIGTDGLIQPIRIIRDSEHSYRIEEGERRWWAHHILVQQGKEQFRHILAFVVEPESTTVGLLRRRVAENVHRSGFTAMELANAMSDRIQEILAAEPGIKHGEAEQRVGVEHGMSARRVRQFVALLTLSPEAQELAQQARLSENSLRAVVGIKDPARQLIVIRELISPAQKSKKPARKPSAKKTKLSSQAQRAARQNLARRPSERNASTRHKLHHSKLGESKLKRQHVSSAMEKIHNLIAVAKTIKSSDWEHLHQMDWKSIIGKETDYRALANIHTALTHGLRLEEGQLNEGMLSSNE